jgi:hypothetical protein
MVEGPVMLHTREGAGEYRTVAACVYMRLEKKYGSLLQKTDLTDVVYVDSRQAGVRYWRLMIAPASPQKTKIQLIALRSLVGSYEPIILDASKCLS